MMKTQLSITSEAIDEHFLITERETSVSVGAVIVFQGIVRNMEDGVPINAIDYESFNEMACHQFELIFEDINRQWPIESVRLVHRIGVVPVNEPSLW
ncbi:uncharacterized protein METZ01_LOCUS358196, partial [marine metagenome]